MFVSMHDERILHLVGLAIRDFRKQQELSQEKLAELADLHRTYIGSIERGERNPSVLSLERILKALKVSWIDLASRIE